MRTSDTVSAISITLADATGSIAQAFGSIASNAAVINTQSSRIDTANSAIASNAAAINTNAAILAAFSNAMNAAISNAMAGWSFCGALTNVVIGTNSISFDNITVSVSNEIIVAQQVRVSGAVDPSSANGDYNLQADLHESHSYYLHESSTMYIYYAMYAYWISDSMFVGGSFVKSSDNGNPVGEYGPNSGTGNPVVTSLGSTTNMIPHYSTNGVLYKIRVNPANSNIEWSCNGVIMQTWNTNGVIISNNLSVSGNVTAAAFVGSGTGLTGISASQVGAVPTNQIITWLTTVDVPGSVISNAVVSGDGSPNVAGTYTPISPVNGYAAWTNSTLHASIYSAAGYLIKLSTGQNWYKTSNFNDPNGSYPDRYSGASGTPVVTISVTTNPATTTTNLWQIGSTTSSVNFQLKYNGNVIGTWSTNVIPASVVTQKSTFCTNIQYFGVGGNLNSNVYIGP